MMSTRALIGLLCALAAVAAAQEASAPPQFDIHGVVKSGGMPLPGVSITAANSLTGKKLVTSTEVDGRYSLLLASRGKYVVRAELSGFAAATAEVVINPATPTQRADLELVLLSRVPKPEAAPAAELQPALAGRGTRGAQQLSLTSELGNGNGEGQSESDTPLPGMPAIANSPEAGNASLAISGQIGSTQDFGVRNMDEMRERIQEMRERGRGGEFGAPGGPGDLGGPGGAGFGPGIMFGGPGGRRGRFNFDRPHGNLYYSAGNSVLDASPYSLTGASAAKPDYGSSRFGAAVGGPLRIPHVYKGTKTFFVAGYTGTRATNLYDVFSHVPTEAERGGDFSATAVRGHAVQLFDPATGAPLGSQLPANMIDPRAAGLLRLIPLPNQPGQQNFRFSSAADTNSDNLFFRVVHNFSGTPAMGRGRGGPRNNLNFGLNYSNSSSDQLRPFPAVGGRNSSRGLNLNAGYALGKSKTNNILRFNFNQMRVKTTNFFAGLNDVEGALGMRGVSTNPADWGAPVLSFANFRGLNDVTPQYRNDRSFQIGDTLILTRGKHNLRLGGDYRRLLTDVRSNSDPRGTFTFTGFTTAQKIAGQIVAGTGYDFADFLLGLPQQTSIQYSPFTFNFSANSWDAYVQDDWRLRGNLTLDLGLRYEYNAPYREARNRIVNLDVAPGFTAAVPVRPGDTGSTGVIPVALVQPDRNNFAPRVGIAWRVRNKTVVRAGYGINYNLAQYRSIVTQLAYQPPFATTTTNIATLAQPLTLANGFPATSAVTNNYGVDPNYRLGYVQLWNLNIQQELRPDLVLNVGYNGSKGTALDMVRAPNRGPTGLRIAGVQPFLWESAEGSSILHAGTVRVRKRMRSGVAVGATYVYSKSIDNASSIGGSGVLVAQDDLNLAAERGLSSFDQRHRFTGDFVYELPLGSGKQWLSRPGIASHIFGDWTWSGDFTIASGTPFTARVLGDLLDVGRGTNGTLRADYNGQPIALEDRSVLHWFNTAAFSIPAAGQFGNSGRNTIIGPGTVLLDLALAKNFPIHDTMGLEIRGESSNVLNHANFTGIDTLVNSPTFGQVISVGSMRRMQLFARFRF